MKYSEEFNKPDYTKGPYPIAHSICGKKVPPDGEAQPRLEGSVIKHPDEPLAVGLSYDRNGHNGDFGPYIQHCGEGLPNSFKLDFENTMRFSAGNVHPHTGLLLFALALNLRPKVIIETGTYFGYSTLYLAKVCEIWGEGKVYTIDCNPDPIEESIKQNPYIECVNNYSQNCIQEIIEREGEVQFAFLDSWKRLALKEFKLIHPYLPEGGVVVFHDTQFLNTGHTLYDIIMRDYSHLYDTMLFAATQHKDNPHKFFGNADDRGLFVLRKKNTNPFYDVADYNTRQFGARLI